MFFLADGLTIEMKRSFHTELPHNPDVRAISIILAYEPQTANLC